MTQKMPNTRSQTYLNARIYMHICIYMQDRMPENILRIKCLSEPQIACQKTSEYMSGTKSNEMPDRMPENVR